MLEIVIPLVPERYDDERGDFIDPVTQVLQLEHSLVSLSKWESIWHKAFLSKQGMTTEESMSYIKCMTVTPNVHPDVYNYLTNENIEKVKNYIEDPMTATVFYEDKTSKNNRETITAELIYYWMIALNIPFECQDWHLNRLLTLIRVCNIKNTPPKKRSTKEIMSRNAALNAARRQQLNTKG